MKKTANYRNFYKHWESYIKVLNYVKEINKSLLANGAPVVKNPNISDAFTESLACFLIEDKQILKKITKGKESIVKRKGDESKDIEIDGKVIVEIKATTSGDGFVDFHGTNFNCQYLVWLDFSMCVRAGGKVHVHVVKDPKKYTDNVIEIPGNSQQKVYLKKLIKDIKSLNVKGAHEMLILDINTLKTSSPVINTTFFE